jgi:hypothetical protein
MRDALSTVDAPAPLEAGRDDDRRVVQLEADGVLRRDGARLRTARRWQGAMARAAFHLRAVTGDGDDLRAPIVHALIELYPEASDDELVELVRVMLPIEHAELP